MKFRHQALQFLPAVMLMCGLLPLPAQAQFAQQGPKLVGTGALGEQGYAVSLSGDGNTAMVGAPAGFPDSPVAAWVFTRSGGVWSQQQHIDNSPPFGSTGLGSSVSVSADGNTAILGAPFTAFSDYRGFGGWVYVRSGGVWTQQAILVGTPSSKDDAELEGFSVALSADGNTAIIGAPQLGACEPSCIPQYGEAWVFTRSPDGRWSQQAKLVGTDIIGMQVNQGYSVSVSGDGNTAIVGGPGDNGGTGAAWVFTLSADGGWSEQAKLVGGGLSVSLSNDGNTAIVGNADSAGVYRRSTDGKWRQDSTLAGTGVPAAAFSGFGSPNFAALSADGNTAMVGSLIFTRSEVGWTQQELPAGTGAVGDAAQGFSVALSGDGHTAIVGGPNDNSRAGAAWVYSEFVFPGTPGKANCHGQRVSALARQFGGLNSAAAALGFASVPALEDAIMEFCWE